MLVVPLIVVVVAASSPVGVLAAFLSPFEPRGSGLHARQAQILVPPACDATCQPIVSTLNNCLTAACACTTQNMNELFNCIQCTVTTLQTAGASENGQTALSSFAAHCMADGISLNVPALSFPPPGAPPPLSNANGPTVTTPIQNPPTGVPLTFGAPASGSSSNGSPSTTTTTAPAPAGATTGATQPSTSGGDGGGITPTSAVTATPSGRLPGTSGAIGIGTRVEVTSVVFSTCVCLMVVAVLLC